MSATLITFGPLIEEDTYNKDFAAVRSMTSRDGASSVFIYRPLHGEEYHIHHGNKARTLPYRMVFAGRVETGFNLGGTIVTLGLPPWPTLGAIDLIDKQGRFLQGVSNTDAAEHGVPCQTWWGPKTAQQSIPTVVVAFSLPYDMHAARGSETQINFNVGDDIILNGCLFRIDTAFEGFMSMQASPVYLHRASSTFQTYNLKANLYGILAPQELRFRNDVRDIGRRELEKRYRMHKQFGIVLLVDTPSQAPPDGTAPTGVQRGHLDRKTVDFIPTRDRSQDGGDTFTCKDCTAPEDNLLRSPRAEHSRSTILLYSVRLCYRTICIFAMQDLQYFNMCQGGVTKGTWFGASYNGQRLPEDNDHIYITVLANADFDFQYLKSSSAVGSNIQVMLGLRVLTRRLRWVNLAGILFKSNAFSPVWYPRDGIPLDDIGKSVHSLAASSLTVLAPDTDICPDAQSRLRRLVDVPYGTEWHQLFEDVGAVTLFKLSLESQKLFALVMDHMDKYSPRILTVPVSATLRPVKALVEAPRSAARHSTMVQCAIVFRSNDPMRVCGPFYIINNVSLTSARSIAFPVEILFAIMANLRVAELVQISQVSRALRSEYPKCVMLLVDNLLLDFGLCPREVRFMQTATLSVLAGACIPFLLYGRGKRLVRNLEVHCPQNSLPWVTRFLDLTTSYKFAGVYREGNCRSGVDRSFLFVRPDGEKTIRLLSSTTPSALHCLPHAPFTHQFGAVTHLGLIHLQPGSTFTGATMPNRPVVNVVHPGESSRIMALVEKAYMRGFDVVFEAPNSHTCGSATTCPCTPRLTSDRGCFTVLFPYIPFGAALGDAVYPTAYRTAWTLEGVPCRTGRQMQADEGSVCLRMDPHYSMWRHHFLNLIALVHKDRIVVIHKHSLVFTTASVPAVSAQSSTNLDRPDNNIASPSPAVCSSAVDVGRSRLDCRLLWMAWALPLPTGLSKAPTSELSETCAPGLRSTTVVFAGCVSEIAVEREPHMPWGSLTVVTLALPPDANIVAQEIMARQDRFLQQISSADVLEAGVSCRTCCGSSSPNFLHTPLNISISFPGNARRVGEAARPIEFNVGDDIICRAALIRVDHDDGKVLTMTLPSSAMSVAEESLSVYAADGALPCTRFADYVIMPPKAGDFFLIRELKALPLTMNLADLFDHEPTHFFAGLQYGVHCLPTRERTLAAGHFFTFKDLFSEENPSDERGSLVECTAELFGRVDGVVRKLGPVIFPYSTFDQGGVVMFSWLSNEICGQDLPKKAIYVQIRDREDASRIRPGQNVALFAYMQRIDADSTLPDSTLAISSTPHHLYALEGCLSEPLGPSRLPLLVEPYLCDRFGGLGSVVYLTFAVETRIYAAGHITLNTDVSGVNFFEPTHFFAGLQYGVHCVPTRERSLEFGHLFTFKDIAGEQHPLDDERGVLLEYTAELFGRVDMVTKKDGGFLVRLVCPLQIGCRLVELHRLQYEALRTILGLDSAQEGGVVTSSWLSCDIEGAELPAAAGALYVYIDNDEEAGYDVFVGQNIVMFAYMQRIDTNLTCAESGNIYHLYSLVGFSSGHLADEGLPLLVEPYICDRLGAFGSSSESVWIGTVGATLAGAATDMPPGVPAGNLCEDSGSSDPGDNEGSTGSDGDD
ncbi:hypothetical protein C8R43DRAFT_961915 [Mycena crocata]|nr:hypothetical protein C8R43DRAFT_961915 [Mycena crocata]